MIPHKTLFSEKKIIIPDKKIRLTLAIYTASSGEQGKFEPVPSRVK